MQNPSKTFNPNALVQTGMKALAEKRPEDAKDAFKMLIEKGTQNASIWIALAYAHRDLGEKDALLDAINKSIEHEPRNPRAYLLKADLFLADGDTQAAAAFYLQALNVAPPPEQTPKDLKPELERAQKCYSELTKSFEDFLLSEFQEEVDAAGEGNDRISRSLDYLMGKSQPYFQQPKTYYFPELPNIQFYNPKDFSWVEDLEASTDDIREELLSAIKNEDKFSPYLSAADNRPQSDPHGLADNKAWSAFYLWKDGEIVEEHAAICPKTIEALKKVPLPKMKGRAPNVLFSLLRPGSKIPPHNGLINTRLICHLPLIIPEGCGFRVGNETREWREGKIWLFDDTIEHEAWNNSDENRYILLLEIWKPELGAKERAFVSKLLTSINCYNKID